MQDILFHPGFHRTGTSSMQHFMWRNHVALTDHVQLMMLRHMKPVLRQVAHFATTKNPLDLMDLAALLDDAFEERALARDIPLLITSEGFCGHMPGRKGIDDYSHATPVIQYVAGYLTEKFPGARLRVVLTTREKTPWLRSIYRYHLRMTRITMDEDSFVTKYQDAADFDSLLNEIAAALAPIEVSFIPLEDAASLPFGPGEALLQQFKVPAKLRKKLKPVGRGNEGPSFGLREHFTRLNHSDQSDAEVAKAKQALSQDANLGAWRNI